MGDKCLVDDIREPRREEAIARDVVSPYVNGTLISIDDPLDFALCRNGELVGWAEVTTAVDAKRLALENWIKKNTDAFSCDKLSYDWWIIPRTTAKLDNLDLAELVRLLVDHEGGIVEDSGFVGPWDDTPMAQLMRTVRIEWLQFTPLLEEKPTVRIQTPTFGGSVGPSLINDLAVEMATRKAQALAGRDGERHLIVLVNYDYPTVVGLALTEPEAPDAPINLPEQITDVWLSAVRSLLWHYSTEIGAWEIIEIGA